MEIRVIVSAVIQEKDKLLFVREAKPEVRNLLNLPGGRLEERENLVKAVIRETKEETGYDIEITGVHRIYNYLNAQGKHVLHICFRARLTGGNISFNRDEILDVVWFSIEELDKIPDSELRGSVFMRNVFEYVGKDPFPLNVINDLF